MTLFTIEDLPTKVIISGDLPDLDYSKYIVVKAHITSIKQQKESFGNKIVISVTNGDKFELNYQAFDSQYGFQNNNDLREHLENLI